ncbi:DNA-3-methyladenine glycosylase II [Sediminihabitans luteus]|uniref:DNA-3-methyladenine glycosylase II n=1 Tax=Sediminihabitans luteus TaxID=1138585 RepID=A0A2M9D119_9CELL|nr:AlkA N-terminal domain-containing protein [Sediminihabitans luteus]PJJ77678.1 DNA-3-methyladenine glycosylase II [Sediminihabitans luteus]GIJ00095.1 DNA-3-methyladenine glycosylase [Sediminihabitans luteus]
MSTPTSFDERYRAISARDRRFDGQFITAVRTTGIYCRPSCPARTPKPENVAFYLTSAAAHEAGFRACKRCLPDAVPGTPAWNAAHDLAARAMRLVADGVVDREGVPGLAARLGYSERHLGRVMRAELGAGPLAVARAVRAQTARTLVTATDLPFADVAFAAGFGSIRQFNDTVAEVFGMSPTVLRATRRAGHRTPGRPPDPAPTAPGRPVTVDLTLPVRAPFDAAGVLAFLDARAVDGVEQGGTTTYARTLALPHGPAAVEVHADGDRFAVRLHVTGLADLPVAIARVRRLFDLDADPLAVDEVLGADPALAASVRATPGIRLPGAVDPHEVVLRAMIGQQISVKAARTHLGRLATLGTPADLGPDLAARGLGRLFPTAAQVAEHGHAVLGGPRARVEAILGVAAALADGSLDVSAASDPDELRAALLARRGVGPWTAGYVAMRVLGDPDVLLGSDLALRAGARRLGLPDPLTDATTARWAPWRSYAGMHLWRAAAPAPQQPAR